MIGADTEIYYKDTTHIYMKKSEKLIEVDLQDLLSYKGLYFPTKEELQQNKKQIQKQEYLYLSRLTILGVTKNTHEFAILNHIPEVGVRWFLTIHADTKGNTVCNLEATSVYWLFANYRTATPLITEEEQELYNLGISTIESMQKGLSVFNSNAERVYYPIINEQETLLWTLNSEEDTTEKEVPFEFNLDLKTVIKGSLANRPTSFKEIRLNLTLKTEKILIDSDYATCPVIYRFDLQQLPIKQALNTLKNILLLPEGGTQYIDIQINYTQFCELESNFLLREFSLANMYSSVRILVGNEITIMHHGIKKPNSLRACVPCVVGKAGKKKVLLNKLINITHIKFTYTDNNITVTDVSPNEFSADSLENNEYKLQFYELSNNYRQYRDKIKISGTKDLEIDTEEVWQALFIYFKEFADRAIRFRRKQVL